MNAAVHLALIVQDSLWPALQVLTHWHRQAGGVARLLLCHPANDSTGPLSPSRRLERFARELAPDLVIERTTGDWESGALQRQLAAWAGATPGANPVIALAGVPAALVAATSTAALTTGCRVLTCTAERDWLELRRDEEGLVRTLPLPEIRREITDEFVVSSIVRALLPEELPDADFRFAPSPLGPLPVADLTDAAATAGWRWPEAFRNLQLEVNHPIHDPLFERYLGALVLAIGVRPATRRLLPRPRTDAASAASPGGELWIHHAGRLVVLDVDLSDDEAATTAGSLDTTLTRLADQRRSLASLDAGWVILRPRQKATAQHRLLARALGCQILDQADCHTLPSRLATLFGVPLGPDGAEVERRLQTHLSVTGRTRLFGDEPAVLQQPVTPGSDPLWTRVDHWLDRVMVERGQNWLLWTHRGRAHLRVPAGGRPAAAQEWRLLAVVLSGLDDREVTGRPTPDGTGVVLEFPDAPGPCRRLSAWLQPFANHRVTFSEAQARFAAQARVDAEATNASGPTPPRPPATAPAPLPPQPTTSTGIPIGYRSKPSSGTPRAPRPPAPKAPARDPQPPRPPHNPLADLDRALDDALGG